MKFAEVCTLFPLMPDAELKALADDIKKHGQHNPILTHQGAIIDGRNRWKACELASVKPILREWDGSGSVVAFVLSQNLHRRQLTVGQRGTVAAESLPLFEAEAAERKKRTEGRPSEKPSANLRPVSEPPRKAADDAAAAVGVSPRTVQTAKALKESEPELFEKVKTGEMTLNAAANKSKAHVSHNSGDNEWYTPADIIEKARSVMGGIDLDPASCEVANKTVKAKKIYTEKTNGLGHEWGGRMWLNPPYAQPLIGQFIEKLSTLGKGDEVCVLVNNATETKWGQGLLNMSDAVCFIKSRIKFVGPEGVKGSPLQGQMVCYIGRNARKFAEEFSEKGATFVK